MKKRKTIIVLALILSVTMILAACAGGNNATTPPATDAPATDTETPAASGDDIVLGHLAYHTGPFGHLGEMFDGTIEFVLEIVNQEPPIDRSVRAIHADIGTLGEGQVARRLLDGDKADILYNVAGEYLSYREWLLGYVSQNNAPMMPSIHAGAVPPQMGGTVEEPLFRGSPMDTDQAMVAVLHLLDNDATNVAVVAIDREEMQMQQMAAVSAAEILGIEVLGEIDIEPEQTSYRNEATQLAAMKPEAVILFGAAEDAGTFLKNATELGVTDAMWFSETNAGFPEFLTTATLEAIQAQKFVRFVSLKYSEGEAWDYFKPLWEASPYAHTAEADNYYVITAYDVLNMTMLAIEKSGSTDTTAWVPAMYEISMGPGEKVYNYLDGIKLLREGQDIDYEGVTGSCDYTPTGIISAIWEVMDWSTGEMVSLTYMDGPRVADLGSQIDIEWN